MSVLYILWVQGLDRRGGGPRLGCFAPGPTPCSGQLWIESKCPDFQPCPCLSGLQWQVKAMHATNGMNTGNVLVWHRGACTPSLDFCTDDRVQVGLQPGWSQHLAVAAAAWSCALLLWWWHRVVPPQWHHLCIAYGYK